MEILTVNQLKKGALKRAPICAKGRGVSKTTGNKKYKDLICTFDIETSILDEKDNPILKNNNQAIMYIWQFCVLDYFVVIGRTWDEFRMLLNYIHNELNKNDYLAVYVHLLSHEFQYIRGVYPFKKEEVTIMDGRKILKATMSDFNVEFRCSYIQSNMSLHEFLDQMDVQHKKQKMDYKVKRYPWTELTEEELTYCINDVVGLAEAIRKEMELDNDNLYTIPNTATGYVRRDVREAVYSNRLLRATLRIIYPTDPRVFQMLKDSFMGGNVYANRHALYNILENVHSVDRSSSHPEVQVNYKFPMSNFKYVYEEQKNEIFIDLIYRHNRAVVARVAFHNIKLKNGDTAVPYIPWHKCHRAEDVYKVQGRILQAEYIEIAITDVDFDIISNMYDFEEFDVIECAYTRYDFLPDEIVDKISKYYKAKTKLKGDDKVKYNHTKKKLNGIFGMSAQDPTKPNAYYVDGEIIVEDVDIEKKLKKAQSTAYSDYAWGVWTAAWSRFELQRIIDTIEDQGGIVLYVDTDGVKYIGDIDFTEYNDEKKELAMKSGIHEKDLKGKEHYIGYLEDEGTYKQFATIGSKKYAFVNEDGKTHITIAGVEKIEGGEEIDRGDIYGKGIERFVDRENPFVFRKSAGTIALYVDDPKIKEITVDGKSIEVTPNILIKDNRYSLSDTQDYIDMFMGYIPMDTWSKGAV